MRLCFADYSDKHYLDSQEKISNVIVLENLHKTCPEHGTHAAVLN